MLYANLIIVHFKNIIDISEMSHGKRLTLTENIVILREKIARFGKLLGHRQRQIYSSSMTVANATIYARNEGTKEIQLENNQRRRLLNAKMRFARCFPSLIRK